MVDNDDILIAQFFEENKQNVEDNGFSHRVKHALPPAYNRASRIWSIVSAAVVVAFFFLTNGLDSLRATISSVLGDMIGVMASLNLSASSWVIVAITLVTLASVSIYNIVADDNI